MWTFDPRKLKSNQDEREGLRWRLYHGCLFQKGKVTIDIEV